MQCLQIGRQEAAAAVQLCYHVPEAVYEKLELLCKSFALNSFSCDSCDPVFFSFFGDVSSSGPGRWVSS